MSLLSYGDRPVEIAEGETVLSALLRAGIKAPHGCRAGVCQGCVQRALQGEPPAQAQEGLSDAQKAQGFFLACICAPKSPLILAPIESSSPRLDAIVRSMDLLAPDIMRLRIEPEAAFPYRAGQFLELVASEDLKRCYSLASHPEEDPFLEMHIRLHPDGRMSRHLSQNLSPGDRIEIAGPEGNCFYEGVEPDQPLVLIGAGTGLAPLWGVLRDALRRGHRGPIRLYHGARDRESAYHAEEMEVLARARENFAYRPCVRDTAAAHGGDVAATALADEQASLAHAAFFLCGGEKLVARLKRELFLGGAKLKHIRADVFTQAV
ncbi:FAD-binding oxidoreductase [Methylocystis heyeri]|uniref:2Fe-2S iron-sulfur cluster binding domain-containing protein n=1 Tax=Methylocystis heyeri TaxID=391905 RepID=A0A6B8KE70_9HYPH|nr:2Fe-2S iron-sulfur cluster-binding protein [Methylocystis heyeri]QGM45902.1 2Fe-2S iron-sulfur cluster binding domain-containing protein [Methylocystis heyeri]